MKRWFLCLAAFLSSTCLSLPSSFRTVYGSTPVTTSAWVEISPSVPNIIESVSVFDSSGQTLALGVGASGAEVTALIIPPGGGSFPLSVGLGARLSLKAISDNATSGENDITAFQK